MKMEIPKPFIPDFQNHGADIASQLNGHQVVLQELAGWAREVNAVLASLAKQQADQLQLIQRLQQEISDLKPQK